LSAPIEAGASIAYAAPVGSAEAGGRTSDTVFGAGTLDVDASYRFTQALGVVVWGRYALGIPTLCATASDCVASVGHDIVLAARTRVFLPRIARFEPYVDAGIGIEWLTTKLSDAGATSRRTFAGPVALSLELGAPYRLSDRWTIGPVVDAAFGVFTTSSLETPAFTRDRSTDGRSVHGWLSVAFRLGRRFGI
jgi:hypothetical protein